MQDPGAMALLFDVDGTLAETEEAHRRAFNQAFQDFGLPWDWDPARYRALLLVGGGKERIAAHIATLPEADARKLELSSQVAALHAAKVRLYAQALERGEVTLRPILRRLCERARQLGLLLGIATTTARPGIEALLRANLGEAGAAMFDVIVAGDEVPRKKPSPDVYTRALQTLGVAAHRAVAFEDAAIGVRAAQAAGIFTIAAPSVWTSSQDLAAADLALASFDALASPAVLETARAGARDHAAAQRAIELLAQCAR